MRDLVGRPGRIPWARDLYVSVFFGQAQGF